MFKLFPVAIFPKRSIHISLFQSVANQPSLLNIIFRIPTETEVEGTLHVKLPPMILLTLIILVEGGGHFKPFLILFLAKHGCCWKRAPVHKSIPSDTLLLNLSFPITSRVGKTRVFQKKINPHVWIFLRFWLFDFKSALKYSRSNFGDKVIYNEKS